MTTSMWLRGVLLAVSMAAVGACGKDGGGSSDPKALCEQKFQKVKKILNGVKDERKPKYLERCATLPIEFLKCSAAGTMTEACGKAIRDNGEAQSELNSILTADKEPE